jgi:aerobic carbon-monoxide dehydrogenase medium subunit
MIPVAFDYRRPTSVEEAVQILSEHAGEARALAGGHSLIPLMKLRLSAPGVLVDIGRLGLSGIEDGNPIRVGATTTHAELAASAALASNAPVLSEAAAQIGDPQVRHRGTIGGSLAHADPAGDLPAAVVALDAEIVITGTSGERAVRAGDFFQDLFTVDLAEDELITAVRFAPAPASAYAKLPQRASHYALVGIAAALDVSGGTCQSARIAVTGIGSHSQRVPAVEEALAGRSLDDGTIAEAAELIADGIRDVNEDIHASADYRREMAKIFARRAIAAAAARA